MKKHPFIAFILGTTVGIVVGKKILTDKNMERIESEFETLFDKINSYGTEDDIKDFDDIQPKSTRYVHIPIPRDTDEQTEIKEDKKDTKDIKVDTEKVDDMLKISRDNEEKQQEGMKKVRSRSKIQKKIDSEKQKDTDK